MARGSTVPCVRLRDGLPAMGATWEDGLAAAFCTAKMVRQQAAPPDERTLKHLCYLVISTAEALDFQTLMEDVARKRSYG